MYIDHLYQSTMERIFGSRSLDLGPFSRIGGVGNVVICGVIGVVALWSGITGQPAAHGGAVIAGAMEVMFVRVCIRAFRGDFDEFVPDSTEPNDDEGLDTPR